jgi:hypothetical protein
MPPRPKKPRASEPVSDTDTDTEPQQQSTRQLRYLREEGLFRCAICDALVCHAPDGDVSPTLGERHVCAT